MSGNAEPWIPPGQGSLVGKKFSLLTFAMTFFFLGALTLWEADRSHFSEGVLLGLVLVGVGLAFLLIREIFLAKGLPEPIVTGEEIEDVHALIKRYATHTKSVAVQLAAVTDDDDIRAKLNAIADMMAELET